MRGAQQFLMVRWGLAIFIALVFILSSAYATSETSSQVNLSSYKVNPGDTVYFNATILYGDCNKVRTTPSGDYWIYCRHYPVRIFIQDLNGAFIEPPNAIFKEVKSYYRGDDEYSIYQGSFKIPEKWVPADYKFYINHDYYAEQCSATNGCKASSTNWRNGESSVGFSINGNSSLYPNWQIEVYGDKYWRNATLPAGDSHHFGTNVFSYFDKSAAFQTSFFVSKFVDTDIAIAAENVLSCSINGNVFASSEQWNQLTIDQSCAEGGTINGYLAPNGDRIHVYCDDQTVQYGGELRFKLNNYLKSGINTIYCSVNIDKYFYEINRLEYPGRAYFDANFKIIEPSEIKWTTDSVKNWWTSAYDDANWKWGELPVKDSTPYRSEPFYIDNAGHVDHYVVKPYNGQTTYFRKLIWSNESLPQTLMISDTKVPTCYFNEKTIALKNYSDTYWQYYTNISLKQGWNILACQSKATPFNQFDYRIVNNNGMLYIKNVTLSGTYTTGEKINFSIALGNASHPEIDVAVVLSAKVGNHTYSGGMTETFSNTANMSFTVPEPGNYNLTFAAIDLHDGDKTYYSVTQLFAFGIIPALPEPTTSINSKVGFMPMSGSVEDSQSLGGSSAKIAFAALGTAALAGTSVIGGYSYLKNKGISPKSILPIIDNSLSNASDSIDILNSLFAGKQALNKSEFGSQMNSEYIKYQEYMKQIAADQKEMDSIIAQANKERKAAALAADMKKAAQGAVLISGLMDKIKNLSPEEQEKAIKNFMDKNSGKVSSAQLAALYDTRTALWRYNEATHTASATYYTNTGAGEYNQTSNTSASMTTAPFAVFGDVYDPLKLICDTRDCYYGTGEENCGIKLSIDAIDLLMKTFLDKSIHLGALYNLGDCAVYGKCEDFTNSINEAGWEQINLGYRYVSRFTPLLTFTHPECVYPQILPSSFDWGQGSACYSRRVIIDYNTGM